MKLIFASLLVTLGTTLLLPRPAAAADRFACNLHALNGAERARHRALTGALLAAVADKVERVGGYGFRLPAAALEDVAAWVGLERRCCPFFTFDLRVTRDGGPVWLEISGSDGVKDFIRAEFGL